MVGREEPVLMTLLIDRLARQYMSEPVPDNFLYGCVAVEFETADVVQVRPTDGVKDC